LLELRRYFGRALVGEHEGHLAFVRSIVFRR
jgi:hypothetical protein